MTEQNRVAAIYNPQNQTKAQLIEGFVVRQGLFKRLFQVIKEGKMEVPEQNYLIMGRRGMGKTTLLLRLATGSVRSYKRCRKFGFLPALRW